MKFISLILWFLLSSSMIICAQDQDMIVTNQLDTLYGKVSISDQTNFGQRVAIKNGKVRKEFSASQLKFIKKSDDVFHVNLVGGSYTLTKYIHGDFMSLYNYTSKEAQDGRLFKDKILILRDGRQFEVPNLGFRPLMADFVKDCEVLKDKILDKAYTKKDLIKIIDEYNACFPMENAIIIKKSSEPESNIVKVDELIARVKEDKQLASQSDVEEMLMDIKSRLKKGEKIPKYLDGIIREKLSKKSELLALYGEIKSTGME